MTTNGNNARLRIVQIGAKNFKIIRSLAIEPSGDIITISGDTGQGKTSVLEVIETTLRGGDQTLVRRGADHSELFVEVGDLQVSRSIDLDGREKLAVSRGGKPLGVRDGKALLDALFGEHCFRPIEWVQLSGGPDKGRTERVRRQREELLRAMPMRLDEAELVTAVQKLGPDALQALSDAHVDIDLQRQHGLVACEVLRTTAYNARSVVNQKAKDADATLKNTPVPPATVPTEELPELQRQERAADAAWQQALGADRAKAATRARVQLLRDQVERGAASLVAPDTTEEERLTAEDKDVAAKIDRLEVRRAELRQELRTCRERNDQRRRDADELQRNRQELADLEKQPGGTGDDPDRLREKLERARDRTHDREVADRHAAVVAQVQGLQRRSASLGALVDLFREVLPGQLLARAKLPIADLGLEGEQITIKGVPIHRLGTSEQIRLGVRVAVALNPQAGFVCVDGAESLGADGRRDLAEAAAEAGVQLWMSEVSAHPDPGSIVMQAGEVVGAAR